jgi:hypothetical protein
MPSGLALQQLTMASFQAVQGAEERRAGFIESFASGELPQLP